MAGPSQLLKDNTLHWTIKVFDRSTNELSGAYETPTVAVRKNGAATADTVTVTARSTGIYDCSYDPSGEAEGDVFQIEVSAELTATSVVYHQQPWSCVVVVAETVALTGPNDIDITIVDNVTSAAIEGASVRMHKSGSSETKTTGSDGTAQTFTVVSATWTVSIEATGYTGQSNSLVVAADDQVTYRLVPEAGGEVGGGWIG